MFINLSYEEFEKLVTMKFSIKGAEQVEIELCEVSDHRITARQEMFSLIFKSSKEYFLQQGLYDLTNEQYASAEVFLVPISQTENGYTYEAVLNRLLNN